MSDSRPLWRSSIRHRFPAACGLFAIIMVATAGAAAGPMLVRAAEASGLKAELARSADRTPGSHDIVMSAETGTQSARNPGTAFARALRAADPRLFYPPLIAQQTQDALEWSVAGHQVAVSFGYALRQQCVLLAIVAGRCPSSPSDVLVPGARAAPAAGDTSSDGSTSARWVGQPLRIVGATATLRVSGVYRGGDAVPAALAYGNSAPLFVTPQGLNHLSTHIDDVARARLRSAAVDLDRLPALADSPDRVARAARVQGLNPSFTGDIDALVAQQRSAQRVTTVLGSLVVVPSVLLAWYALVLMMQLIATVRAPEWALGRLRGLPTPRWLRSLFAEPAVLVAAGTIAGALAGTGVAWLTAAAVLTNGTSLEPFRLPVVLAVAGTAAGAVVGIVLSTVRGVRLPLATLLLESAERPQLGRSATVVQSLLVAVVILALVQVRTQPQLGVSAANLGLVLPGLLAMLVSLAVIRVGVRIVRRRARTPPRTTATLLLARRLARNPAMLWRHALVAVALAVMLFALQLALLAQRNVYLRAGNQVGAAQVMVLHPVNTQQLLAAVQSADPTGRYAMAVQELTGTGSNRVVALDTTRMSRVAAWNPSWAGLDVTRLRRLLAPAHAPEVRVRGTQLRLSLAHIAITVSPDNDQPGAGAPHPVVTAVVEHDGRWVSVAMGSVTRGRVELSAAIPCADGCVLRQLSFVNDTATLFTAQCTVTSLSTDRQPAADFEPTLRDSDRWQNNPASSDLDHEVVADPGTGVDGLAIRFQDLTGNGQPGILPADGPELVPAVVARGMDATPIPGPAVTVQGSGLDGQNLPFRQVAVASVLPRAVDDGSLVDLRNLQRLSDPAQSTALDEVWLAPGTPRAVLSALTGHGLSIESVQRRADVQDELLAAPSGRVVVANLGLVAVLAVLVVAALAAGFVVESGRRRHYFQVLRDTGIPARDIRRYGWWELAIPTGFSVLIGTGAALVSLLVFGARLPVFDSAVGPPLATSPHWTATAWFDGAALVVVVGGALLLARVGARAATRHGEPS